MKALFDNIKHGGNFGSILRHAFCFDVQEIFLTENQQNLSPRSIKEGSCGYNDKVLVTTINLENFLTHTNSRKICPLPDPTGIPLTEFEFLDSDLLVFGNEQGISNAIKAQANVFLYIPMCEKVPMQCLNLATAFSIIAYTAWIQKKGKVKS